MSRIARCFTVLKQTNRSALIIYIAAGDPHPDMTVDQMHSLVDAGTDILELGVPFSDPMADGPVIQQACERALAHNVRLVDVIDMVAEFRKTNTQTPVVLMGYMNPIEALGASEFASRAATAGVDGVLTVDLPPDASEELIPALQQQQLDPLFLLSPTTPLSRMRQMANIASGFLYYVSLKGVTGANTLDIDSVRSRLQELRTVTELPIGVGFGIRDADSAARVARIADAVVVGSAVVQRIGENADDKNSMLSEISQFVSGLRQALDSARQ